MTNLKINVIVPLVAVKNQQDWGLTPHERWL
jgi:hypothetical protein